MSLSKLDILIILLFIGITLGISIYFYLKSKKSDTSFFVGKRNLGWGVLGLSMVATTFAADTPLAVTEIVGENGISGNWIWWNGMLGGLLTAVFFAHLWRRSGVITENELLQLRYFGKPARYLRMFKSIYLGFFMNVLTMGWVNLAMITILESFFDIPKIEALGWTMLLMAFVAIYSSISGFLGVVYTDMIQFAIAMVASIALAYFILDHPDINGIAGLKSKLKPGMLNFLPSFSKQGNGLSLSIEKFIAFFGLIWWASWYPGQEPGGGGYIAQRIAAAKDEKNASIATIFFQIAHICIRPWPWIIVALAATILYPTLSGNDLKNGYVFAMKETMPNGLKGLMLTGFIGAYMSTISTHLNWGASYLVNDFLRPFFETKESNISSKKEIFYGRICTLLLMIVAGLISTQINSIKETWLFIMECGAGLGLVLILRWYWWRINAWSEISATIAPFLTFGVLKITGYIMLAKDPKANIDFTTFPNSVFIIVLVTTLSWLLITYLTSGKESKEKVKHLKDFYLRIKPNGVWQTIAKQTTVELNNSGLKYKFALWVGVILFGYSLLFLIGNIVFNSENTKLIVTNTSILILCALLNSYLVLKKKALN